MNTQPAILKSASENHATAMALDAATALDANWEVLFLRGVGGIVTLGGAFMLMGWAAGFSSWVGAIPNAQTMKANTSLGFTLIGVTMLLLTFRGRFAGLALKAANLATVCVGAIGLITLLEYVFGVNLRIDELLVVDFLTARDAFPGRMGVNGAICQLLASVALWILGRPGAKGSSNATVAWAGALIVGISIDALIAHFEARRSGYNWLDMMSMAVHAAFIYTLLGIAFLRVAAKASTFRWAIGRSLSFEFVSGLAVVIAVAALSYLSAAQVGQETLRMKRTREALEQIWAFRAGVDELEAVAHGDMLSGNDVFRRRWSKDGGEGAQQLRLRYKALLESITADPTRERLLEPLHEAVEGWLGFLQELASLRESGGFEEARRYFQSGSSREWRSRIDVLISELIALERAEVGAREREMYKVSERTFGLLPSGVLLSILVLSYGMVRLNLEMMAREKVAKALAMSESRLHLALDAAQIGDWDIDLVTLRANRSLRHDQIFGYIDQKPVWTYEDFLEHVHPEDRAGVDSGFRASIAGGEEWSFECRILRYGGGTGWIWGRGKCFKNENGQVESMRGVIGDITQRRAAEEEIRSLNATLEQRVRERTLKLETAMKELDAFSYSVSHDLRAPLRAIDGFSRMVIEEYSQELAQDGQRKLAVIRTEAQRMSRLIDDLLTFSRLGRAEIQSETVDMRALAQEVFNELTGRGTNGRKIQFEVQHLPVAVGAQAMIRQVWVNLIGNAIKFTRGRELAEIEVGFHLGAGGETVYSIKDNGVGFDMRHVGKLFGVFQRLHSEKEFEGTGVGLALVQRIVSRHGGRVWADAEEGRGSTFFFTLPKPSL
ncbi:MAG: Bacteriophytochrome/PAS domain-containing protein [Verrucomicrobia bacterium]|nr:MAG: Bacteriophytochrome/PAS domain-containing protein [Verrucomicrobiota bacterium]